MGNETEGGVIAVKGELPLQTEGVVEVVTRVTPRSLKRSDTKGGERPLTYPPETMVVVIHLQRLVMDLLNEVQRHLDRWWPRLVSSVLSAPSGCGPLLSVSK